MRVGDRFSSQQGFATVLLSVLLLSLMTVITLLSAKTAKTEQMVSGNERRTNAVFYAAEGGMNLGVSHLQTNLDSVLVDGDTDGFIDPYTNAQITNVVLANGSSFTVTYSNPVANNFDVLLVTAIATSDDGTAIRQINQIVAKEPYIPAAPVSTITARGTVEMGGNITLQNIATEINIWAGGSVDIGGSASTTTSEGVVSDSSGIGNDVYSDDVNLAGSTAEEFFRYFFGTGSSTIQSAAGLSLTGENGANYSDNLADVTNQLIWIEQTSGDGHINSNITIGSPTEPVILVVNGNLHINGNVDIYGLVYVTGELTINGNANLYGALISASDVPDTGTPTIVYDEDVLNALVNLGAMVKVPGGWSDF